MIIDPSFQEKLKELEAKVSRCNGWEMERAQLKDTVAQNTSLIHSYKKEERHLKDERDALRRQVEDQARIMAELQKMATSRGQSGGESEKLAALRKEKDQMVELMGEEIQTMQRQIMTFQQERDTYKEQLKAAEEKIVIIRSDSRRQENLAKVNSTDVSSNTFSYKLISSFECMRAFPRGNLTVLRHVACSGQHH